MSQKAADIMLSVYEKTSCILCMVITSATTEQMRILALCDTPPQTLCVTHHTTPTNPHLSLHYLPSGGSATTF